jgi:hypothetical protein
VAAANDAKRQQQLQLAAVRLFLLVEHFFSCLGFVGDGK